MGTSVFANVYIDSGERFLRMRDSFNSIKEGDFDRWYVNVRGSFRSQAVEFLTLQLGSRLELFDLQTRAGWLADSLTMIEDTTSDHFLIWLEDHICVGGSKVLNQVLREMQAFSVDYLMYSFFHNGMELSSFESVLDHVGEAVAVSHYGVTEHHQRLLDSKNLQLTCSRYVVSLPSIISRSLLSKILATPPTKRRWSKWTPFDFEREPQDVGFLPMIRAVPLRELFASIDDDHGEPGYSLIARGTYPARVPRSRLLNNRRGGFACWLRGKANRLRAAL